jgi:hypothetical protein
VKEVPINTNCSSLLSTLYSPIIYSQNKNPGLGERRGGCTKGNFSRYERLDQQNVKAPAFAAGRVAEARKENSSFMGWIIPAAGGNLKKKQAGMLYLTGIGKS